MFYMNSVRQQGSVSVCSFSLEQSETEVLAPLVITYLKHRLQTGFVVSVGLPLLLAT